MENMEEDGCSTMTAGVPSGHLEGELENVCRELALVDAKVAELLDTQTALQTRRDQLSTEIQARQKRRERSIVRFLFTLMIILCRWGRCVKCQGLLPVSIFYFVYTTAWVSPIPRQFNMLNPSAVAVPTTQKNLR